MFEKERDNNQKRWERQAEKENDRSALSKFLGNKKGDKTPEVFMREEAERDDEDFEKKFIRESKNEYKMWEDHCKPVRAKFMERVRNPENTTDEVNVVIFMHGGMSAAGIAGSALAMDMMGINSETVDYVVGVSSGDVVGTRFAGGRDQLLRGIAAMNGPLASKDFIDARRIGNWINIGFNKALEDKGEYAVDTEAIQGAHCKLWNIVSEPMKNNADPVLRILDKKTIEPGITAGTAATMSIPLLTGRIPEIDGKKYFDGGFGVLPVKDIVQKVRDENPGKKINVLIYTQASFAPIDEVKPTEQDAAKAKRLRKFAGPMKDLRSLRPTSDTLYQLARGLALKENLKATYESIRSSYGEIEKEMDARIGVIFAPPSTLDTTTIDPDELAMATQQSFFNTFDLFGVPKPDEMPRYIPENQRASKRGNREL